jgi:hypothetical protein
MSFLYCPPLHLSLSFLNDHYVIQNNRTPIENVWRVLHNIGTTQPQQIFKNICKDLPLPCSTIEILLSGITPLSLFLLLLSLLSPTLYLANLVLTFILRHTF